MQETKKTRTRLRPVPLFVLGAVFIMLIAALFSQLFHGTSTFEEGRNYLNSQAELDQSAIQAKISSVKQKQLADAITNGDSTIFAAFNDSVIFGDSRVYGFDVYGFMPSKQVLAATGNTILNITDYLDQIRAMQPAYIYFSYGANDMEAGIGNGEADGYAQVYKEQIDQVLEASPDSKIIVNSIIECTPAVQKADPSWNKVADFNKQLQKMCQDNGWTYVNNSTISQNGESGYYQDDGIHFLPDFYPVWAENMIRTEMPDLLGAPVQSPVASTDTEDTSVTAEDSAADTGEVLDENTLPSAEESDPSAYE